MSRDQSSFPSPPCVSSAVSRFCSTSSSSGRGGDPQSGTWRASSLSFTQSWRRDQFFQLRDDRKAGPLACRVRCCVSASMFVVGPFGERRCERLVLRGKRVPRHQLQVRDQWEGSGGEREVQVGGRRRRGAASSASPSPRHAGTARAVSLQGVAR